MQKVMKFKGKCKIIVQIIFGFIIIALILGFLAPITVGVFRLGALYPIPFLALLLLIDIFPNKFKSLLLGNHKLFFRIISILIIIGLISVLIIVGMMKLASIKKPYENATVIVLGCQVRGSVPSKMLYDRMNKALVYLNDNPESKCVASGAQGPGEDISEAQAIFDYLVSKGISENRIFIEDKSASTSQNIEYSAEIIHQNNLNTKVAIATDNFHQLRAGIFARSNSLEPSPLGTKTFKPLVLGYWAREVLAVVKAVVLGY